MKGPYQRLQYDLRRLWECPECGKHTRASGDITFRVCSCQNNVSAIKQKCMKLVEDFTRRDLVSPPPPEYKPQPEVQERPSKNRPQRDHSKKQASKGNDRSPTDRSPTPSKPAKSQPKPSDNGRSPATPETKSVPSAAATQPADVATRPAKPEATLPAAEPQPNDQPAVGSTDGQTPSADAEPATAATADAAPPSR